MAIDKSVDSSQLDSDLTSVANAIRTKGGTSASLVFPLGFISAIGDISGGGGGSGAQTGTVTPSATGTTAITFGTAMNSYLFYIEMAETSKSSLVSAGMNTNKMYAAVACYPNPSINNKSPSATCLYARYNASTDAVSYSNAGLTSMTDSGLGITTTAFDSSTGSGLYVGCTYNWVAVPIGD